MIDTVDGYLKDGCMRCKYGATPDCKVNLWRPVLVELRKIVVRSGLLEEVKWGVPCYTDNGKNILLLSAFKEYACISFMKGSMLLDPAKKLIQQGVNTQEARIIKYYKSSEVKEDREIILKLIQDAVEIERSGRKLEKPKATNELPEPLLHAFEKDVLFKEAFYKLSPSKQRGYLIGLSSAKQTSTLLNRIEKLRIEITAQ
ncbi:MULTISPECIES: YdeI/OmpD-associated family protein [unclassified Paraflavitalea]|uniref:YdeI/OmpD-associated family protein n=1 Tax=unclassified Paraflavitalea TaxID=2798305 RepID=UPI003D3319E8